MAERYFRVRSHPLWVWPFLFLALVSCSTTPGRQAPVEDVAITGQQAPGTSVPASGQPGSGTTISAAPAGGSVTSEEILSDDLMDAGPAGIPPQGAVQPRDTKAERNLAMAGQSPVIINLMQSADVAYVEERWEDAASVLERALRIEPGNGLLWQRLAEVRFAQGDYLQTVQLASKSDALAGTNRTLRTDNLILMIEAYEAMGDFDRADVLREGASDRVNRTSR